MKFNDFARFIDEDGVYTGPASWPDLTSVVSSTKLTSLGSLRIVKGNAFFAAPNLVDLGDLTEVYGELIFKHCTKLKSLGQLKEVGENLSLTYCNGLKTLGNLQKVRVSLGIKDCFKLADLGQIKSLHELQLSGCPGMKSLGNALTRVDDMVLIENCTSLSDLGSLEEIGGTLFLLFNLPGLLSNTLKKVYGIMMKQAIPLDFIKNVGNISIEGKNGLYVSLPLKEYKISLDRIKNAPLTELPRIKLELTQFINIIDRRMKTGA